MYLFLLAVACQHNLKFWKWKKYIYVTELPTDKNIFLLIQKDLFKQNEWLRTFPSPTQAGWL